MSDYAITPERNPGPPFEWGQMDPRQWRRMRRAFRAQGRADADPSVAEMGGPHRGHRHGDRHDGPGGPGFGPGGPGFGPGGPGFGPETGFGPGGPFGPGWRRGRRGRGRGRAGRGDTRLAILALLADGPRHGYQLIQEIAERSDGAWRPSPGSIYPALSALQDEGLLDDEKIDGKRVFSLTEAGRAYVEEQAEALATVFQANSPADVDGPDPRRALAGLGAATVQVSMVGSAAQQARAVEILDTARRELYLLLAEADDAGAAGAAGAGGAAESEPEQPDA